MCRHSFSKMFFLVNLLILSHAFTIAAPRDIPRKKDNLLMVKADMHKLGEDLENVVFDIVKEVVKRTDGLIDSDYEIYYEDSESEESPESPKQRGKEDSSDGKINRNTIEKEHMKKSEKSENFIGNASKYGIEKEHMKTSEKSVSSHRNISKNDIDENHIKKSEKSGNSNKKFTETNTERKNMTSTSNRTIESKFERNNTNSSVRHKRSMKDDTPEMFDIPIEEKSLGDTINLQNAQCVTDAQKNELVERKNIEELKEEVKKLYDLVVLLKDQQKILSQLDNSSDKIKRDIPKRFESKDLLKVLEHLNNADIADKPREDDSSFMNTSLESLDADKIVPSHKELEKLKYDLRQAVLAFNKTHGFLVNQRKKEIALENELQHQKVELNLVKMMIKKLFRNVNVNLTSEYLGDEKDDSSQIVGIPPHIPKSMPASSVEYGTKKGKDGDQTKKYPEKGQVSSARASDLDDISRLLDEIDKPKMSDLELKIEELQEKIEKKNREEKQLKILQKILDRKNSVNSNSLLSDDNEALKKLQLLLRLMGKPQSKSDDNIEDELSELQSAIEKLRPKDELGFSDFSKNEKDQLRDILNGKDQKEGTPKRQKPKMTRQEILELKKKLDQLTSSGSKKNDNMSQNIDIRAGPLPNPFWSPYNRNYDRGYSPYPSYPYQINYNGYEKYSPSTIPEGYIPNYVLYPPYPLYQQPPRTDSEGGYYRDQQSEDYPKPAHSNEGNHLFLAPHPSANFYYGPDTDHVVFPEDIKGGVPEQPAAYLQKNDVKTKSVEDLKIQISSLQNIINDLSNPESTKRPEDQRLIGNLEQQINELKNIVNGLNADTARMPVNLQPPAYYSQPQNPAAQQPNEHRLSERSVEDVERSSDTSKLYDDFSRKVKSYFFNQNHMETEPGGNNVASIKKELDDQLKGVRRSYARSTSMSPQSYYHFNYPYNYLSYPNVPTSSVSTTIQRKKDDLSTALVIKIFDKIIIALPAIIERLFGEAFYGLSNVDTQYSNGSGHDLSYNGMEEVQRVFYNLGIAGYVPLILLKLINGLTTFLNVLKKNQVFKNFLLPVLVLVVISGSVIFLIWWFQPDEMYTNYNRIGYNNGQEYANGGNYNEHKGGNTDIYSKDYQNNNVFYGRNSYRPVSYSKSYENGNNKFY